MPQLSSYPRTADYSIGWICALHVELTAAEAMLEEMYDLPSDIRIPTSDTNQYRVGRIGQHNVVIASCPAGVSGTTSAAVVAANMLSVFDSIRVGMMVGIGGGIPSEEHDIRLGDVVVSQPTDINGGVVQYDYGKILSGNRFLRKGALNKPPAHLLQAIGSVKAKQDRLGNSFGFHLDCMLDRYPHMRHKYGHPGADTDLLFESDYEHAHEQPDCGECDSRRLVYRNSRVTSLPHVHYGTIGSANTVLRDAQARDTLWKEMYVICVEMEAAGLMDNFPCIVIRGISDYADSHKHKAWQPYAAAAASAYAKELLSVINKESIARARPARPVLQIQMSPELGFGLIAMLSRLMEARRSQAESDKNIELSKKKTLPLNPLSQQSTLVDDGDSASFSRTRTKSISSASEDDEMQWGSCAAWCSCVCHRQFRFRSPKVLGSVFGLLLVSFSNQLINSATCTEHNCADCTRVSMVKLTYFFPTWLLCRMVLFMSRATAIQSPEFTLRVPRIINGNADIFLFAEQGNLIGIQKLFERRQASVDDVASSTGRTALHCAIVYNNVNICRFLVKQGAKKDAEDKDRQSSVELAWIRIFGKLADERALEAMQTLFEDEEFFETREFPALHKIVLGLNGADLTLQLRLTTSNINDVDADGRTALSWAAARGDDQIVLQLLKSGADPNKPAPCGRTPLHWASQSNSVSSMKWLVHYEADVNAVDKWLRTPLIYASCNHALDDPSRIQLLIDAGAYPDFQDCRERTALGYAVKHIQPLTCRVLLDAEANLNLADNWGYKPLFEALKPEYISTLDVLLKFAKNWTQPLSGVTINGQSILHLLAVQADSVTLKRFYGADFTGVDCNLRDIDGNTADSLLQRRDDLVSVLAPFTVIYEQAKSYDQTNMTSVCELGSTLQLDVNDVETQEQYFDALEEIHIHDLKGTESKLDEVPRFVRIIEILENPDVD